MEPIKILNHYSLENPASIFDEEAMTALKLAGRTAAKTNEVVQVVNEFTQDITEQQQTFEERVDGRVGKVESSVSKFAGKLVEFETETIPETVEQVTRDKIESGALDHVVQESIEVLGTELDALVNTSTNAANANAEIVAARVGNGRVTYPTLGDAIRGQTTNIKPLRLNPEGHEWKGDNPVPVDATGLDHYYTISGFNMQHVASSDFDTYYYSVLPGHDYLYTCNREITAGEIANGWFIFEDDDGEVCMGGTNLSKFVTLVEGNNWVYRIRVPLGATYMRTVRPKDRDPELWLVSTEQQLKWLQVGEHNIIPGAVTPVAINRKKQDFFCDVEYQRIMHYYKSSDGQTITGNSATGMCCCVLRDVQPGEVYRIPVGKDVSNAMGNYFVFEDADGLPAVQDIQKQVELVNTTEYIYHVTIPNGCITFYTACDSITQLNIQEVCSKVSIPWLKVTEDNLEGVTLGGSGRLNVDYIWEKPEWAGKTVVCIGDSITAGIYSDDDGTATEAFGSPIERFCESVGAELYNYSVSGSGYYEWAYNTAGADSLEDILGNVVPDIVIVALGVNDFRSDDSALSSNFSLYCSGVLNKVKSYLYNNEGTVGIAITPIPCDMEENAHGYSIEYFRRTIFANCVDTLANTNNDEADSSPYGELICVDGGDLPIKASSGYLPDGLHPSMKAQHMFAQWLRMKLT